MMAVDTLQALMTTGTLQIPSRMSVTEDQSRNATYTYFSLFSKWRWIKLHYFENLKKLISYIAIWVLVGIRRKLKLHAWSDVLTVLFVITLFSGIWHCVAGWIIHYILNDILLGPLDLTDQCIMLLCNILNSDPNSCQKNKFL